MDVIVIGANGNLGRRLVDRGLANGHRVTAFVRDAARFASWRSASEGLRVLEGDAADPVSLREALTGHDALVSAAGTVTDGSSFIELTRSVIDAGAEVLPAPHRMWVMGGAAALDVAPRGPKGIELPGVPPLYQSHVTNLEHLDATCADWSMMCPGPMVAASDGALRSDLRISVDVLPSPIGRWARYAPPLLVALGLKRVLTTMTVTYEDVAETIMRNLDAQGPYRRRRVGVALPVGERRSKDGWVPGERSPDA